MHEVLKKILFCLDDLKWTVIIRSDGCMKKMTACFYI